MSILGILMSGFCVAAILFILWCLAIEGVEHVRKRKIERDPYERSLKEIADIAAARDADKRSRERAYELAGR
jgi:hypothetical protein